ncbi:condensation domain-containing protein, partial [Lysinibacillus fusiformis]|uniref:condensation domain-containing protein n=1 Tax=Lysinibacillus fusiformis TaxID=28031 RepID=UPI0037FC57DF
MQKEYVAPRNELEQTIAHIWEELLGVPSIGIHDHFFELGGNSLKIMTFTSRFFRETEMNLAIKEVFKYPTIAELSEQSFNKKIYTAIPKIDAQESYELSFAEKRMYAIYAMNKQETAYNIPGIYELYGKVEIEKVKQVFQEIVERHDSLRTRFVEIDQEIKKQIISDSNYAFRYIENQDSEIEELIERWIQPFDLAKAPLIRVIICKRSEHHYILFVDMHHIISDGQSMEILVQEFKSIYEQLQLPENVVEYKDFSQWQNQSIESEEMKKQEAFWVDLLTQQENRFVMPTDFKRTAEKNFTGETKNIILNKELKQALLVLAKQQNVSMYTLLLSIYGIVLSKFSNQNDLIIGSPFSGRLHPDVENIIGLFVNTVTIPLHPNPKKAFLTYLQEVQENMNSIYDNQMYPFDILVQKLAIKRSLSNNALFDFMFTYQSFTMSSIQTSDFLVVPYLYHHKIEKFDITVQVYEQGDQLLVDLSYATMLYRPETIEALLSSYIQLITNIVKNPDRKLHELLVVTDEQSNKIKKWNDTKCQYPKNQRVEQAFIEQVAFDEDKIALVSNGKSLSYGQLAKKTKIVSQALKSRSVTSGASIGIISERNMETVIQMLGVLEANCVYIPLDIKYPVERLHHMMKDAEIQVVLGSEKTCPDWLVDKLYLSFSEIENNHITDGEAID